MRLLICFDGTENSSAIIEDLRNAGLGENCEAVVMTVAEGFDDANEMASASNIAQAAVSSLTSEFPSWKVETRIAEGSAGREIVIAAEELKADLIVVGEPALNPDRQHIFLGQTTSIVVNEAPCSVRVARKTPSLANTMIVGFDGSAASVAAIEDVAGREWPTETSIKLVVVADSFLLDMVGRFAPQINNSVVETKFVSQWAETLAGTSIRKLRANGVTVNVEVLSGRPQTALAAAAKQFGANCIFVGPHNVPNSFARFVVGSVSAGVAKHADCSVEIVRR